MLSLQKKGGFIINRTLNDLGTYMKKIWILIAALVAVTSLSYAGQGPVNEDSSDSTSDMGADEQVFVTKLNDENTQLFAQMSSQKKKEAMDMTQMMDATGVLLSPNEAVSKVASTDLKGKTK